ncbi:MULTISPECIES: tyrosine-type recombinase/integrase [Leptospira]|uniref:Recombinase XerD n=1 Tax=Leptospira santarosai TaxID=28183 RepID=A0AB73M5I3_9LEPT|nr:MULTISPECIES: tyrosine-type recombinase/integrase [Leptospira]AVV52093.1 Site-specific recombinase, phage integrase family [Leptospira santarosai]EKO76253.1 site-specific recombinase, phage integrase family [Leptospira sp. Fiocruz LV3954]EMI60738.1 site-specific recombinase, phage integrase family [Leptospira sp. Fiocruz LV4135]MDI7173233.1 tyrosine-type recombinase/integrase [Leptospira santarosai]MDI7192789.1 tyrosine-type recombinase/integrase [Leptospira santarosai]
MAELDVPKKNKHSIERLIKIIRQRNYKKATAYTYMKYNLDFLHFADKPAEKITVKDLNRYMDHLRKRKVSSSTIQINVSSLKMFFEDVMKMNLFQDFQRPVREYSNPNAITYKEMQSILKTAASNAKHELMCGLVYFGGLRVGELITLRWAHLDTKRKSIHIKAPILSQSRTVEIPVELGILIKKYEKEAISSSNAYLFPGKSLGAHTTSRNVERIISEIGRNSGISSPITVFTLRHSRALHLIADGSSLNHVKDFLGHKTLASTESYLPVKRNLRSSVREKSRQDALKNIRKKFRTG